MAPKSLLLKRGRYCCKNRIVLRALLFSNVCPNTLPDCVFAIYHYNFVTYLSEHITVPKIESLALLFEMNSFEEMCQTFRFK
jgi:hypothetical protein